MSTIIRALTPMEHPLDANVPGRDPRSRPRAHRPLLRLSLSSAGRLSLFAVGSHHQVLHRDEVVQHGPMGCHLVPAYDRVENAPMVRVRSGRTTRRVEGLLTALGEEVHERADDPRDGAIVGTV